MTPSSRTPEGSPHRCNVCGKSVLLDDASPVRDATCPYCGSLIWLARSSNIGDVRGRIRILAQEIESLSNATVSMAEVAIGMLSRIVTAVGARGGVIWRQSSGDEPTIFCSIGIARSEPETVIGKEHTAFVRHVFLASGDDFAVGPGELLAEGVTNPCDFLLICCRFTTPRMPTGMVEVLQRADTPIQAQPGFLQFVQQMTKYLARSRAF